ncbi:response regulator [Asticcacaulis endophyticus]|uniref:Response regulatory domain-containing protein n=1 Tax=Asticcacaulis endophyticus TaxID=1395890 RepID=A0A918Q919_9CAUL|nr:response regulator [Asticcacaulis endophyticus]GGZ37465.1 hypothetical protein GCM10011273_24880 [Asticcacaulis endophyticus]
MSAGTVLVLEDSRTQAQLISKMMEKLGWSTLLCFDHDAVFEALRHRTVDLMLLDVYIGTENTLMLMPDFRKLSAGVPIAVMSAGGAGGQVLKATLNMARRAQADFVIGKPFAISDIKAIIDKVNILRNAPQRSRHILVIDDSGTTRKLVASTLSKEGYQISEAQTVEEAFVRIDIAHVDMIITDIFMPGMGGIEGISVIHDTWPQARIIAMSGEDSVDSAQKHEKASALKQAVNNGANASLTKPFRPIDLAQLVDKVFSDSALLIEG